MPKKKAPAEKKPALELANVKPVEKEEVVEPPIVIALKVIDDKYLAIEREYEKELNTLRNKYNERQLPLLVERAQLLSSTEGIAPEEATKSGTPALNGFWLTALKHLPDLEEEIEEWDEPVLEYLTDIKTAALDLEDPHKGFKISFHFKENPWFTNDVLWKEYHTEETSPYTGLDTTEIKVSEIKWNAGKNVTVETIVKKPKGGGSKKSKQKPKEKEEPRDSFFRNFFRHLTPDMPMPEDVQIEPGSDSEEEDEEDLVAELIEDDYETGCAIRDQLIPFAVRWYTGEAAPDDDDDDDADDDDSEYTEESEDETPPPRRKGPPKRGR